tara:strand:+ start:232 stop:2493 length:2262 start_codon:yes stop_codon:yes gene_type:complete
LPNFDSEIKNSNIAENWLFVFTGSGDDLYLSFTDAIVGANFYYGAILNQPTIRESLDLAKSTAKTSNISVQIPDFMYKGAPISQLLVFSSNYFINQVVTVYSLVNNVTRVEIGSFRLTDVKLSNDQLNLLLTAHKPSDFITFPQNKTTEKNIPVPISYGNYTKNSATTFASSQFTSALSSKTYRPVPFNSIVSGKSIYVDGSATSDAELAVYEKNLDIFVPLEDAESSTNNTDGAHHGQVALSQKRAFKQRVHAHEEILDQIDTISNPERAYSTDNTESSLWMNSETQTDTTVSVTYEYSLKSISGSKNSLFVAVKEADGDIATLNEGLISSETGVDLTGAASLTSRDVVKINNEQMIVSSVSSNTLTVSRGFNGTSGISHDSGDFVFQEETLNVLYIRYGVTINTLVGNNSKVRIVWSADTGDVESNAYTSTQSTTNKIIQLTGQAEKIRIKAQFISQDTGATQPSLTATINIYDIYTLTQRIEEEPLEELYTANDGLPDNGWNSNAAITEIHEAHRDLLSRFAGLSDSNPAGWSNLNSDKDWAIRYWQNEEIDLEKALNKLQFEGGFIYSPNRGYIHIRDSESVDVTLSKNDLANISIEHTSFSELQTSMQINYQKHPAEKRYIVSQDSANSTTRTNYNLASAENKTQVNLDTYVSPTIPATPSSNPNDDWYTYYDNIFGSIKAIVSATIVNPKFYNHDDNADLLGIGSRVQFTDMYPEKIFGKDFTDLIFLITDFNRSPGKISITAREVS